MNGIAYTIHTGNFLVTGAIVDYVLFHSTIGGMDFVILSAPCPKGDFKNTVLAELAKDIKHHPYSIHYQVIWMDAIESTLIDNSDHEVGII